jgi:hypothetical protein
MHKLLNVFLNICLLRAGPQDVPAASVVMLFAAGTYVVIGILVALSSYTLVQALLWSVLDTLLLAMVAQLGLRWRGYPRRFQQTFSALTGSGALLSLVSWPFMLMLLRLPEGDADATLPSLLIVLLMFWSIAVIAHILRHALSSSYAVGVLLALLYAIVSWNLGALLFPQAT